MNNFVTKDTIKRIKKRKKKMPGHYHAKGKGHGAKKKKGGKKKK